MNNWIKTQDLKPWDKIYNDWTLYKFLYFSQDLWCWVFENLDTHLFSFWWLNNYFFDKQNWYYE
jgi:hypothetical protein